MQVIVFKKKFLIVLLLAVLVAVFSLSTAFGVKSVIKAKYNVYVVIDPGHGGSDGGAVSRNGLKESDVTLNISKRLKKMFLHYGIGVVMTRESDIELGKTKREDMERRKEIIENTKPSAVISIHANTFVHTYRRGVQVFYAGEDGKMLAEYIQKNANNNVNALYNGNSYSALTGDYYIVKCTTFPSCIVECGFLSNRQDELLLQDDDYIESLTFSIFAGTIAYLYCNTNNT